MPPKWIKAEAANDDTPSASPSPSKKAGNEWSEEEEIRFMQYINALCTAKGAGLWALCKDDELLKARGSNGITSHWNSLYKKLSK